MFNAIVASLIDYTGGEGNEAQKQAAESEDRQLKEVMVLSKLEQDKKTGKLNLDGLKRRNNNKNANGTGNTPRETPRETPAPTSAQIPLASNRSIIPPATVSSGPPPATFVVKGQVGNNPNLPPPAVVTSVVKPIPSYGTANRNIVPSVGLTSMNAVTSLTLNPTNEEQKLNQRLAAPKELAPLASKSRA